MEYTVDKIIQSDDTAWGSKLVSSGGQNISSDVMDPTRWVVWWIREGTEDFFFFFGTLVTLNMKEWHSLKDKYSIKKLLA